MFWVWPQNPPLANFQTGFFTGHWMVYTTALTARVKFGVFTIGEYSELEKCQIAGNPTVFSRPNLAGMVTNYQVIYSRWFWT